MPSRPHTVDPVPHLDWAAGIARKVARRYHLRDQEADEVASVAALCLIELCKRTPSENGFDVARAVDRDLGVSFRVWAYRTVSCACRRAVEEMRGGGTFHTTRTPHKVGVLSDAAGDVAVVDPPEEPDVEPPEEPVAVATGRRATYGRTFARRTA